MLAGLSKGAAQLLGAALAGLADPSETSPSTPDTARAETIDRVMELSFSRFALQRAALAKGAQFGQIAARFFVARSGRDRVELGPRDHRVHLGDAAVCAHVAAQDDARRDPRRRIR